MKKKITKRREEKRENFFHQSSFQFRYVDSRLYGKVDDFRENIMQSINRKPSIE